MSFNQFSPELLIQVFSHLLDVGSKIRLERVNRRFRDCVRNVESWKYNTELTMAEFESVEKLRSFLSHTKVVNTLDLTWAGITPKYLATLLIFSDKLKIKNFSYVISPDHRETSNCRKYVHAVAACLGKFVDTLEFVDLDCCGNSKCPTLETISYLLPLCRNLREIWLAFIGDDEDEIGENQGNNLFILDSLMNMSLDTILLCNFYSTISAQRLAAVCNTAEHHSLSTIILRRDLHTAIPMHFQLAPFCQALDPGAVEAIRRLELEYIDCDWIELLPTFPTVFPNLASLTIKHGPTNPTAEDAMNIAQALGDFLHASAQHKGSVTLDITFTCEQDEEQEQSLFGRWLWNSVNLIDAWRSGTKRTADMQHWKRTLNHADVTVSIELE